MREILDEARRETAEKEREREKEREKMVREGEMLKMRMLEMERELARAKVGLNNQKVGLNSQSGKSFSGGLRGTDRVIDRATDRDIALPSSPPEQFQIVGEDASREQMVELRPISEEPPDISEEETAMSNFDQ